MMFLFQVYAVVIAKSIPAYCWEVTVGLFVFVYCSLNPSSYDISWLYCELMAFGLVLLFSKMSMLNP